MKIIQITDHNGSGGVNSFVYDLCEAQKELGDEIMFLSIIRSENEATEELKRLKDKNIKVVCLGAKNKKDAILHYRAALKRGIKRFAVGEPCICNLHLKLSVLMGVLAGAGLKNVKIVETYHNKYHHYELQYAVLHPWISHYIAISHTCGEEMRRRFHTQEKRMTVIPNGIDRKAIRQIAYEQKVKKHEGILMMTVARLSYEKNVKVPVEAFGEFCSEGMTYRIVGDGPQREEIRAAAKENKYIEFTGQITRSETLENLAEADIVIMPSLWEGRSILQLEAMALDKPMILSDVPALREVFDEKGLMENETWRRCAWGYLVQTNNTESYRVAAKDFMVRTALDKNLMAECVKAASLENDMKAVAEEYKNVYCYLW